VRFFFFLPILLTCSLAFAQTSTPSSIPTPIPSPTPTSSPSPEAATAKPTAWLVVNVTPVDFSWNDLGLSQESSFTTPLYDYWQKFIQENSKNELEVKSCQGPCESAYESWLDREVWLLNPIVRDEYTDGLWIKLSYNISRERNSGKFSWEGRVLLQDVNSKMILASYDLGREEKNWGGLGQKQLNSALATRLYQSALAAFRKIAEKLSPGLHYTRASRLVIRDAPLMSATQKVVDEVKIRGMNLGLACEWKSVVKKESHFLCLYRGEEKSFSDLLSQLKELKSSKSYNLGYEVVGTDHVLTFVP
jgi:hypothetical protein